MPWKGKKKTQHLFEVKLLVPNICGAQDCFLGGALGSQFKLASAEEVILK